MDYWFAVQLLIAAVLGAAMIALLVQLGSGGGNRTALDGVAFPVWVVDGQGVVAMRNAVCTQLGSTLLPVQAGRAEMGGRWFDVTVRTDGAGQVFSAVPVDGVIRAEVALREFRTTMSDTFAQLETGLGLFDAEGKLQMFNPALADLTGLPVEFLMRRPSLGAVLDALRDCGLVPEPKDWLQWRRRMLELSVQPAALAQQETWGLPGGATYRATLRPQAKGSFALLLEDISTETVRSRRYRADMELAQSVIDTLDEGIAVFAGTGQLVLSNAAYAALWGHDPGSMIGEGGIGHIAAHWREVSAPDPLWGRIEEFVATAGEREAWHAEARLRDGRLIECRIAPILDGATMAAFRPLPPDHAIPDGMASVARYKAMLAG